jgi:hypothetical protein
MREALQGAHLKKCPAYKRTLAGDIRLQEMHVARNTYTLVKNHTPMNASAYPVQVVIGYVFYRTIRGDNHRTPPWSPSYFKVR